MELRLLDLFSGIAGFSLGFERAGIFRTIAFCETGRQQSVVLKSHWPDTPNLGDVRNSLSADVATDIIVGGDPCPSRSRARGNRPSKHPDMSGWFLAVVAAKRPRWVVRENVPAPDVVDFAAGLESLGYPISAFALDARDFTGQSRRREFVLGCPTRNAARAIERTISLCAVGDRFSASRAQEETPIAACLTAHPLRLAAEDTYCFEPGAGLRVLSGDEAEALQGFPRGWTLGLAERTRRMLYGNAVCVPKIEFIARAIAAVESAP